MACLAISLFGSVAQVFGADIILAGGRVIDPETGLDDVRDVVIAGDQIIAVVKSDQPAQYDGKIIDVSGLVVSPGFIDLHAHGQTATANEYQAHDGVTTALELEAGYPRVAAWLQTRRGNARVNYGTSVAHGMVRSMALSSAADNQAEIEAALYVSSIGGEPLDSRNPALTAGLVENLPLSGRAQLVAELDRGLREGALGIGMPHQYYPGADRAEILSVFQYAASVQAPIYTHVRSMGMGAMQEVVANAAATGAPLHIVHVNSSSLAELPQVLELIGGAIKQGLDITTEAYPYTAASTAIESAIFEGDWQSKIGITYQDLQWQDTNERLTKESFEQYRRQGGIVIIHMMKPEWIEMAMRAPFVMVASDGMPYAPGAHPRTAGTFARVLGRYVREQGALTLGMAISKMTLMPAQRLEAIAPMMKRKGRVQVGVDADITVFDPAKILDTATFDKDLSFSTGIEHVLVNGRFVVRHGKTVEDSYPGRAIVGRHRMDQ